MSQLVEDFKAGKLDLVTLDWNTVPKEDQDAIMALIGIDFGGVDPGTPIAPQPPAKPIKSKNRGLGNTVKYAAIAGLVIGAGVAIYTLVF